MRIDGEDIQDMRGREFGWSLLCLASGAGIVYALRAGLGSWPNPVVVVGVILITVGLGLVGARYSRLGPFDGALGAPWRESELRETILYEAARAARYGRALSVAVVRTDSVAVGWETVVRSVDRVARCRHGWTMLLLPETGASDALRLMQRVAARDPAAQAVLVCLPDDVLTGDELVAALHDLLHQSRAGGRLLTMRHGNVQSSNIAAV